MSYFYGFIFKLFHYTLELIDIITSYHFHNMSFIMTQYNFFLDMILAFC